MGLCFRVAEDLEAAMNTFYEHHHTSIRLAYRCFDRMYLFTAPDRRMSVSV